MINIQIWSLQRGRTETLFIELLRLTVTVAFHLKHSHSIIVIIVIVHSIFQLYLIDLIFSFHPDFISYCIFPLS